MPLDPDVRFRFRRLPGGRKQRLAFKDGQVVEVTPFSKSGRKGKSKRIPLRTN